MIYTYIHVDGVHELSKLVSVIYVNMFCVGKGLCNRNTVVWAFKIATYIRYMGLQAVDVNAW